MIYCEKCQKSEGLPDNKPVDPAFCEVCGDETSPCFEGGYGIDHPAIAENVRILAARLDMRPQFIFWRLLGAAIGDELVTDRPGVVLLDLYVRNHNIAVQVRNGILDHLGPHETPLSLWEAVLKESFPASQ